MIKFINTEKLLIFGLLFSLFLPSRIKNIPIFSNIDLLDATIIIISLLVIVIEKQSLTLIRNLFIITPILIISIIYNNSATTGVFLYLAVAAIATLGPIRIKVGTRTDKLIITIIFIFSSIAILSSIFSSFFTNFVGWQDDAFGGTTGIIKRARSTMGGPILTSEALLLMQYYLLFVSRSLSVISRSALVGVVIAAIVLTFSRAGLSAALLLILLAIFVEYGKKGFKNIFPIVTFIGIVSALLYSINTYGQSVTLFNRFNTQQDVRQLDRDRYNTLIDTLAIMENSELIGMGPLSLFTHKNLLSNQEQSNVILINGYQILIEPHNAFLIIYQEIGLLGLITMCFIVLSSIVIRSTSPIANIVMVFIICFTSSDLIIVLPLLFAFVAITTMRVKGAG